MKNTILGTALLASMAFTNVSAQESVQQTQASGDLSSAVMGCYVDTKRYDYARENQCFGASDVTNPSIVFSIMGINQESQPGRFTVKYMNASYTKPCDSISYTTNEGDVCIVDFDTDGQYTMSAIIFDNYTGKTKNVSATANAAIKGSWNNF